MPMDNSQQGTTDTAYELSKLRPLLRRPLGGLEITYHQTISKGTDVGWLLVKVNTVFPVNAALLEKALLFLAEKHPLLRMSIQCDANDIYFQEMDLVKLDFKVSNTTDWLQLMSDEVSIPFDILNGPLWRCRLLKVERLDEQGKEDNVSDDLVYESTILFVSHHSAIDGRYISSLVRQLVTVLNDINLGTFSANPRQATPLFPPVEDLVVCPPDTRSSEKHALDSSSSISANFSDPPTKAIDDYNVKFHREIQDLCSERPRNRSLIHEFTRQDTAQMLRSCKHMGISSTGVFVAASLQALAEFVYTSSSLHNSICIPFEFMLDLRRFCPKDIWESAIHCLPGVASAPIPMLADMRYSQRPKSNSEIWEMSRSFASSINNEIKSPETFKQTLNMINDTKKLVKPEPSQGKSPYVLCISNIGCLDGLFAGDIAEGARIREIHGHSSILIEDSPIFYNCFYSLNGKLYVSISYCENYTSEKTTQEYMRYIKEYILTPLNNSD